MKRLLISCLMVPFLTGCSLFNNGPGGQPPMNWEELAPKIQSRVKLISAFAFTMTQIKPHQAKICQTAAQISTMLNNYDDQDASFDTVRTAVMKIVNNISDPNIRNAVAAFTDVVLTEAFNYAWEHYENMINQDKVKATIMIARAIGDGLQEACDMSVSSMGMRSSMAQAPIGYHLDTFTVPGNKK